MIPAQVLLLSAAIFLAGCVYTTHRPSRALNTAMLAWTNQQYNDATGHAVELTKFPGATLSFSANETLGVGRYGHPDLLTAYAFNVPAAQGRSLRVAFLTDGLRCRVARSAYETMASATQAALTKISKQKVP